MNLTFHQKKVEQLTATIPILVFRALLLVVIIDPGIANKDGYPAWDLGKQMDIIIKVSSFSETLSAHAVGMSGLILPIIGR